MSENAGNESQTQSGGENNHRAESSVRTSLDIVESYRRGSMPKARAIYEIQRALAAAENREGGNEQCEGDDAFPTYLNMLDEIDLSNKRARGVGERRFNSPPASSPYLGQARGLESAPGAEQDGQSSSEFVSESTDETGTVSKRRRTSVNEELFPWKTTSADVRYALSQDLQEILALLEDWANDPSYVVRKIMLAPGCPDFPPDQWSNIVKGLAVDLNKVLGAHYTTEVEPKQTRELGDLFQLSVKGPKQSRTVRSHGEWVIAFGKTIQATAFALPQRYAEYLAWQTYMSGLFASIQPSFHLRVIEFDRAARLRAAHQKHVRLCDFAKFDDLRTMYLTSYGMGPNPAESSSQGGRRSGRQAAFSGRRDPCHNWNRGSCHKPASECTYEHVCDRRGCRGNHRRPECPSLKSQPGDQ